MNMGTNIEVSANHPSYELMSSHDWVSSGPPVWPPDQPFKYIWCRACGRSFYEPPMRCTANVVAHWPDIPARWRIRGRFDNPIRKRK